MDITGDLNSSADPSITANVNEFTKEAPSQLANQYGSGISQARGLLNQDSGFNSSTGYGDRATSDAIRSRFSGGYHRAENELKLENVRGAKEDHLRKLQVASMAASQEVEDNRQKAILKWKIDQANKKAQGQVLGTVLGITGGIVGGVYGGGPAGAMAGYAGGQGVGQAIGSGSL